MKKLNVIGEKLVSKIKEKFSIEKIMKENKLQSVFKKITILAVIIFAVFTIIIYETLNISYNNQNKIYEDRYSASMYANKINENILNIKISLIIYNSNHNKDISESLSLSGKDIDYNIQKYKMLRNISDEEKKIIDKFIELNTIYSSKIKKIKSYGIKVSLDDFGTGYSSLNYLKKLEVDSVKIDKSCIDTLVIDDGTNVMVNTIIKMCHYFGYEVVAEGVEEKAQVECLKDLNCDTFQGYYFSKPMTDVDFEKEFLS